MPLIQSAQEPHSTAELRRAFSRGPIAEAAALFLRALDAGLGWETATQAVADGIAQRSGHARPAARQSGTSVASRPWWVELLTGLCLYVLAQPLLSVAHELIVAGVGHSLRTLIATGFWQPLISLLRLDPIYSGAAIRSLGDVQVLGVAVAAPVGIWLHASFPGLFLAPEFIHANAFASMVAAPGASVVGAATAAFGADVALLGLAVLVTRRAGARVWLAMFGLLIQAEIAVTHLLGARIAAHQLEAAGLPFALALVFPTAGWWSTQHLAGLPESWQAFVTGLALLALAYAFVFFLPLARLAISRCRRRPRATASDRNGVSGWIRAACVIVAVATVWSPMGRLARAASNWRLPADSVDRQFGDGALGSILSQTTAERGSTHSVSLAQDSQGAWHYLVDGQAEVIRGLGYNPQYAALPSTERARLYQRDFSAMRSVGANTIEGWFESQFDEVTLEYAWRNGLGVILPFELNQDWDYSDPAVQADILAHITGWVLRYRDNPSLRMWAPGNENLHRILYPKWVSQEQVPATRARAQSFAAFLPQLVDRIHELDPHHPVLYRDAEDVYLNWLKDGFGLPGPARPWLVYGANVYSATRLDEIIARWPSQWIGGPLVVSEFAPGGRGPDARATGYQQDWQRIRARPDVVLGGLAYTWATNGPEELDRVFGLVDADGKPCDTALSALAAAYLSDVEASQAPAAAQVPLVGKS